VNNIIVVSVVVVDEDPSKSGWKSGWKSDGLVHRTM
jgi:hypothetical protein